MKGGRREEAEAVVRRAEPEIDAEARVGDIEAALASEVQASWGEVFSHTWRRPLIIAGMLAVLQQLTGINAVIYYADTIFAAAGFDSPNSESLATLWAIGGVNVLATLIAVMWVDRFGRKPLLMIGSWGMFLSLLVVGGAFLQLDKVTTSDQATSGTSDAGILALVGLVIFIASFAFSLGPVVWTVINEVFPSHVRGKGVAAATALNWFAAWVVTQSFLSIVDLIGTAGAFFLFAAFCIVTLVFVRRFLPETKGKTLEQVQEMWTDEAELRRAIAARD
jgi:sugar porter (SP) family MFS transporter